MTTLRTKKNKNYSVLSNVALNDERLSFRARGIFAYLMSKPDNWRVRSDVLAKSATEGRDAIRTALNELEQYGYLQRETGRDAKGQWFTETVLVEEPPTGAWKSATDESTGAWKSGAGSSGVGEPGALCNDCVVSTNYIAHTQPSTVAVRPPSANSKNELAGKKNGKTSVSSKLLLGVEGATPPTPPLSEPPSPTPQPDPAAAAWQAYMGKLAQYEGSTAINFGRERVGINTLVKLGWTAEQIADCFDQMKKEDFWAKKHLSAQSLGQQIGAKLSKMQTAKEIGLTSFQRWLKENYGVTDVETATAMSGKTEGELHDDYACFA